MTTVAERTSTTIRRTPVVEVMVGQELEGAGLQRLALLLEDALSLRPARLVVDLADCRALDAAALQVLLNAHARVLRGGGRLSLRAVQAPHARIIALAGLAGVFHVLPALAATAGPGTLDPSERLGDEVAW